MSSETDLDQGGTNRQFKRVYLGPSIGWISTPEEAASILPITAAGTYTLDPSVTLVTVAVQSGTVTIVLPSAVVPASGATAQPGLFAQTPVTIVDIGGYAGSNNIVIEPQSGQNIMGLSSIKLSTNYGGYTLKPNSTLEGWLSISP